MGIEFIRRDDNATEGSALDDQGISLVAFCTALSTSLVVFGIQTGLFLLLRTKLSRIFKPKTYLVPERERTEPPPDSPWGMIQSLLRFRDREIIKKCGLDSYFFLRYLQTLLIIFIPIAVVVIPILVPLNYVGGRSNEINISNSTDHPISDVSGLDTLAWGNVQPVNTQRYWAHLILALGVIIWVCAVFFFELRVYIKIRQDWLTTAEHRLRASATTVLVSGIPDKWLNDTALRGLFDVFPGGIRNIWLTRDFTALLSKINQRDQIHKKLEAAESQLIREATKKHLKKRAKEEKVAQKAAKSRRLTKEERLERQRQEDAEAQMKAEGGQGLSGGDHQQVPHTLDDAVHEQLPEGGHNQDTAGNDNMLTTGFSKLTKGFGMGANMITKTGQGIVGGARQFGENLDQQVETTNGFVSIGRPPTAPSRPTTRGSDTRHVQLGDEKDTLRDSYERAPSTKAPVMGSAATRPRHGHSGSAVSQDQDSILKKESIEMQTFGNTTRKATNIDEMYNNEVARWYQFWKPPSGGFTSPVPQYNTDSEFPFGRKPETTFLEKVKAALPFLGGQDIEPINYPSAYTEEAKEAMEKEKDAEWEKWVKKSSRPTHRLPYVSWMFGIPLLNKKVDTIHWCRAELARLNLEIEEDQNHPERYPLMKSAFIQFHHQVAAHMACQSVIHHIPKHMAPRTVEISPNDVIWDNMAIPWWSEWLRTAGVVAFVTGMIILWTIPVAFSSSLSKVDVLIAQVPWLQFIQNNDVVYKAAQALAGVLPAILLALLLWLVPIIMDFLAGIKGAKTGSQKTETVQQFYFAFLFVQVFLVVSLAAGAIEVIKKIIDNPTEIPAILATNLPKASNYFFSYMILQALSVSSGTLLQIGALFSWYILARITNSTARQKWRTNTQLPNVNWGSYFPVYTNFACISLFYSVIAPLISLFAIITFSLLWIANRYTMLYVNRFTHDTGGVLYPRAINQTFTGLYFMEACMIGLFFIVRDENGNLACTTQAIIMIVALVLTVIYQFLLYLSFGPMLRYLPITVEDEAVLRDQAFQRAQDRRFGLVHDEEDEDVDKETGLLAKATNDTNGSLNTVDDADDKFQPGNNKRPGTFKPVKFMFNTGKTISQKTYGKAEERMRNANKIRDEKRKQDLESQRAIGEALYGGFHDEIEDLTPEERDALVKRVFTHSALRARRPTVWIPRDDIGVSDDEIHRTNNFSEHIWISNEGTALDSKARVVYGRAPPDFSELDIMVL